MLDLFIVGLCIALIAGVLIYLHQLPIVWFFFQPNKDFLLIEYLNRSEPITDRIIYLTENQLKELMLKFYNFYSVEKASYTDEYNRKVISNSLKHSIKQILYLENILKSKDSNHIKLMTNFINSQLDTKFIKIK